MISFKNFLLERIVDPEQLAVRVVKKYGKRTNYGSWLKAKKYENIPLSNYNRVGVNKVENKLFNYQEKLGMYAVSDFGASEQEKKTATARANEASANYKKKFSDKTMKISDLHATQPFIRTDDMEQLKNKISNKTSSDIMVIKHNDKHYIMDGHHTVMAAKFRGEKDVNVKYLDLDAELVKKKGVNENIDNQFLNENKITHSSIIDNEKGLGQVPNNAEVDYRGKRIQMTPSKFLSLATHLPKEHAKSYEHISNHIKSGGKIASPYLNIEIHDDWSKGDLSKPPKVTGHDGRNRMYAVRDTLGDKPTEVHLFFNGHRSRHITPEWIEKIHSSLIPENNNDKI